MPTYREYSSCMVSTPLTKNKCKNKTLVLTESKESVVLLGPVDKTWRYDHSAIRLHSLLPLLLLLPHNIAIANRQFLFDVLPYMLIWPMDIAAKVSTLVSWNEKGFSLPSGNLNHTWYNVCVYPYINMTSLLTNFLIWGIYCKMFLFLKLS